MSNPEDRQKGAVPQFPASFEEDVQLADLSIYDESGQMIYRHLVRRDGYRFVEVPEAPSEALG